ncbi:hypothetical protein F5J12DRAFT_804749, partial [Pisolithus orientalis]|uniref:uncharacterized protein n=1 Tax=Pisolithus orientalis TaxID=936130 RepID=UPI002223FF1C
MRCPCACPGHMTTSCMRQSLPLTVFRSTPFFDQLAFCIAGRDMVRARKPATKTSPRRTTGRPPQPKHPSWTEMITECIITTPDGTQNGVSRPALKKFVEFNYQLAMSATTTNQLNRAITAGTEKGNFVLPKGPSGKVKLAPERMKGTSKENAKPASKQAPSAKGCGCSTCEEDGHHDEKVYIQGEERKDDIHQYGRSESGQETFNKACRSKEGYNEGFAIHRCEGKRELYLPRRAGKEQVRN